MDIKELKQLAQERGLSAIRKKALGTVSVFESKTGKLVGIFEATDEAVSKILTFPVIVDRIPEPAKWTTISQAQDIPKICPNGFGPGCLCLDETFLYLCAVGPCPNKAECNGTCRGHFAQLRKFGNLTQAALIKTEQYHSEEGQPLRMFPAVLPLKMIRPTGAVPTTFTPAELRIASNGIIGMSVKHTGTHYVLLDKDGHVIDRVKSKSELLEQEEEE